VGRGLRGRDNGGNVKMCNISLIEIVTMNPPYNEYILIKINNNNKRRNEITHHYLVPNLRGKTPRLLLSMTAAGVLIDVLYQDKEVPFYFYFVENFYHENVSDFVKYFVCIYWND
jgi:hypothetical protein